MSNYEYTKTMNKLNSDEEQRLKVNSPLFMERHYEIMNDCSKQLLNDLMMEQKETA